MLYVYFGRLEDGAYWLIQGQWIKKVVYGGSHGKTKIVTVCKVEDALRDNVIMKMLPLKVQQYLMQLAQQGFTMSSKTSHGFTNNHSKTLHGFTTTCSKTESDFTSKTTHSFTTHSKTREARELKQKLQRALDTLSHVLSLLENTPTECIEKALSKMKPKERAKISETLLDDAYEAKAIIEEVITYLEKLEQEER